MTLLGSTKNQITKDKNGENVPHLEITEIVLVHCNIVNNDYQQDSRVLCTFVPNKPFGSLLEISQTNHIASGVAANSTDKKAIFKNCASFTNCISKINNTQTDNVEYWYSNASVQFNRI